MRIAPTFSNKINGLPMPTLLFNKTCKGAGFACDRPVAGLPLVDYGAYSVVGLTSDCHIKEI